MSGTPTPPLTRAAPVARSRARTAARWLLSAFYLLAGIVHLRSPGAFLPIVPDWVPFPRETVLATGACEVAGAVALAIPRLRRAAAVALALYAVCVFPANIKHAVDHVVVAHRQLGLWYHVPRLLLQPVIVWWALWAGEVIDWPFARSRR